MRTLLAIYCLIILALLLWPYKFVLPCKSYRNGASWLVNENRIEFKMPGLVSSVSPPLGLYHRLVSGNGFTIEVWLTSAGLKQTGPARIVSYSRDPFYRNFTLGQENSDLVFRLRTTKTDLNGASPEIKVPGVFVPEQRQHIVVSYDFSQCRVYVDGQLRDSVPVPGGTFSNWDSDYQLLIGNEQTGDRPWLGSIERVVLYNRPVPAAEVVESYELGEIASKRNGVAASFEFSQGEDRVIHDTSGMQADISLELPNSFKNQDKCNFLTLKKRDVMDFISNFVMFLPFGLLLLLNLSDKFGAVFPTIAATFFVTVLFSLGTESLQYYIEART
jgi:hypothetical protein